MLSLHQTPKMETAHSRSSRVYTRGVTFLNDGHCTYLSLVCKHQKVLIEENTRMIVEVSKKEIESIIDGRIASIKVIKIPQNSLPTRDLENRICIEYTDDIVMFSTGPSKEQLLHLNEEIFYIRVVRSDGNPKPLATSKVKAKKRPPAKEGAEEQPADQPAEEIKDKDKE